MKQLLLLIAFFVFSHSVLAKQITLWHAYRAKERKSLEILAKEYEKKEKIKVNLLAIPYDAFSKKLTASIPRMQGPDVFIFANDKIGSFAKSGLIESLNFYFNNEKVRFLDMMFKTTINAMVYENKIYAIPLAFKVPVLFYNKKFIKTPPKTFDELIEISKKHMAKDKKIFGLGYENTNFFFHSMFYFAFGGKLFNNKKEVLIYTKEAKESIEYAKYLAIETKIMPQEITSAVLTTLFNKNQLLFVINGPWFLAEIDKSIDYGIAPIPDIKENLKAKPYMSNEGIFLNKYSKNKDEAIKFMKFVASLEGGRIRLVKGEQSVSVKQVYNNNEALKAFEIQAESSQPISNSPTMNYFWAAMAQTLKQVIEQKQKTDIVLKKAKKKIENLLSK